MAQTTQTRKIQVSVKDEASKPTDRIAKSFNKLDKSMKKTAKTSKTMLAGMSRLKSVFGGFLAAMGIREMARAADSFQLIKDRITALWGEGVNAEDVFKRIAVVARETKAPVETLADGFARISISSKDMGLSVDETLALVKSLRQQLRLSGASVAEVNSVFLQFSQSMGLGRIQGQELRAIMLGNAEGAKLLAQIFDTTKGKLRDFGEKGLLTAEKAARGMIAALPELNERADKLKITFGQGMILIFDAFRTKIDELNQAVKGSVLFGKFANTIAKNMDSVFQVISTIVISGVLYKAAMGVSALTASFGGLSVVLAALASPVTLVVTLAAAVGALAASLLSMGNEADTSSKQLDRLVKANNKLLYQEKALLKMKEAGKETAQGDSVDKQLSNVRALLKANQKHLRVRRKLAEEEKKSKGNAGGGSGGAAAEFEKLNNQYRKGTLTLEGYINKLRQIDELNLKKKYEENTISSVEYINSLATINKKYDEMIKKSTTLRDQDDVWAGIRKGAEDTVKSIGTVAEQIAGVTTKAFGHLEDALFDFTKKGKFEFRDFATAILDDINRMIIRMSIIKPLAGAMASSFGGGAAASSGTPTHAVNYTGSTASAYAANGAVLRGGNIIPFASGGIVNSPTNFGMSGGRTGLMGEAGPEAILPLSRGPNGKLGVSGSGTVVNVINNSDAEIETSSSKDSDGTEQIDVYIISKVGEAIGEGQFDRSFQQLYGLNRKGQ